MAGGHDDLGQVGAVATHRLGVAGVDRLTRIVIGAVQEEDREREFAGVLRLGGVGDIGGGFMYQESGPKKPVRARAAV
jgi:hypothetical protein